MPVVTSASTISFPTSTLSDYPISPQLTGVYPNLPIISNDSAYARTSESSLRASALEVHDLVWLASSRNVQGRLNQLYESNAVYTNTFVTATSLPIISDIHSLTHRLCDVRIPKPTALIARILGYQTTEAQMWVAWRIWSEIGTVCETESFDGHRKSIIEHTVHFLLLGGSLHRSARMHTILSFNEQGRITHHQDICDLRELLYLIPGGHAVQSVTTRFAAIGLAGLSRLGSALSRSTDNNVWDGSHADQGPQPDNVAKRRMNASDPGNVLGMSHSQREYSHAPDTDSI